MTAYLPFLAHFAIAFLTGWMLRGFILRARHEHAMRLHGQQRYIAGLGDGARQARLHRSCGPFVSNLN